MLRSSSLNHHSWFGITCLVLCLPLDGCASDYNLFSTHAESDSLANITAMTDGFTRASYPRFSPDAKWLVFQAIAPGRANFAVYAARVRRSGAVISGLSTPIRLTPIGTRGVCPAVSPNGITLLLACTAKSSSPIDGAMPPSMEIYRADNWQGAVAVADPVAGMNLAQHAITHNAVYDGQPDISPNGKFVCFTSNRSGHRALYVMRPDGNDVIHLDTGHGQAWGGTFCSDEKHLLFMVDRPGSQYAQIAVAAIVRNADGAITGLTNINLLTSGNELCLDPAWHPDGEHIVYTRRFAKRFDLYIMRMDGTSKTRLTFSSSLNVSPMFSPDGTKLIWTSLRGDARTPQLFIADFHFPPGL